MVKIKEAFMVVLPRIGMPMSFEIGQVVDNPFDEKFLREQAPQFLEGAKVDPAMAAAPKVKEDFKCMWRGQMMEYKAGELIRNPDFVRYLQDTETDVLECSSAAPPAKAGK